MQPDPTPNDAPKSGVRKLFPSCRDAARLQSEAIDKPLPFLAKLGLMLHLMICGLCRRYGKQIHFLRCAAHDHQDDLAQAIPQNLSAEARERIKERLKSEK